MAESALTLNRAALLRYVGRHLGWDRTPANWATNETTDGNDIVDRGVSQFYGPPLLPGETAAHRWSFLRPTQYLSLESGVGDYDLPEDFGGMDSDLFYADDTAGIGAIAKVSVEFLLGLRENGLETSGYPRHYAISVQGNDGTTPQRWTLMVEPIPSVNVQLRYTYRSNPNQLTSLATYPLGGQFAADALVASCIAAADAMLNDDPAGNTYGVFIEKLRAAVSHDRAEFQPRNLGYNGDPGRSQRGWERAIHATFNDVLYDGT